MQKDSRQQMSSGHDAPQRWSPAVRTAAQRRPGHLRGRLPHHTPPDQSAGQSWRTPGERSSATT